MAEHIDRMVVRAAIERLISGTDEQWIQDAGAVLEVALLLASADTHVAIHSPIDAPPALSTPSASFGNFVIEHMQEKTCVEISMYRDIRTMKTRIAHMIFYDEGSGEPLVFVRTTQREDWADSVPLNYHIRRVWSDLLNRLFRTAKGSASNFRVWVTKEATVVYSDVPEYKPGDLLPIV